MSASTTPSPLQDDREIGIGCSDVDDLANTVYGSMFERYMSNSRRSTRRESGWCKKSLGERGKVGMCKQFVIGKEVI